MKLNSTILTLESFLHGFLLTIQGKGNPNVDLRTATTVWYKKAQEVENREIIVPSLNEKEKRLIVPLTMTL